MRRGRLRPPAAGEPPFDQPRVRRPAREWSPPRSRPVPLNALGARRLDAPRPPPRLPPGRKRSADRAASTNQRRAASRPRACVEVVRATSRIAGRSTNRATRPRAMTRASEGGVSLTRPASTQAGRSRRRDRSPDRRRPHARTRRRRPQAPPRSSDPGKRVAERRHWGLLPVDRPSRHIRVSARVLHHAALRPSATATARSAAIAEAPAAQVSRQRRSPCRGALARQRGCTPRADRGNARFVARAAFDTDRCRRERAAASLRTALRKRRSERSRPPPRERAQKPPKRP